MKRMAWMLFLLFAPGGLHAQLDPLVEFWTGLSTNVLGKNLSYTGNADLTVGGGPIYTGPVSYFYSMVLDEAQGRYEYSLTRSDTTNFPGFNFSLSNEPMRMDTLFRTTLTLEFFPFLDVRDTTLSPASLHVPVAIELSPVGNPLPDTLPLAGYFDTAYPLQVLLDPTHTYATGEWDTIWIAGTEPFALILEDTLPVSLVPYPATCVPAGTTAHQYHLVFEDTVRMWDGSDMLLHLDRHYWMVPGCFIVKDSVYRTLTTLVARGKAAQNQTFNSSTALDNIVSIQENPTPITGDPVRLRVIPGGMRLEGVSAAHRIHVLDLSGRHMLSGKGLQELRLPPGRYVLVVEDPASRTRWVLKGISLR